MPQNGNFVITNFHPSFGAISSNAHPGWFPMNFVPSDVVHWLHIYSRWNIVPFRLNKLRQSSLTTSITSGQLFSKIVAPKIRPNHCLFAQASRSFQPLLKFTCTSCTLNYVCHCRFGCPFSLGLMSGLSKVTISSGKGELLDRMMEDVSSREAVRGGGGNDRGLGALQK